MWRLLPELLLRASHRRCRCKPSTTYMKVIDVSSTSWSDSAHLLSADLFARPAMFGVFYLGFGMRGVNNALGGAQGAGGGSGGGRGASMLVACAAAGVKRGLDALCGAQGGSGGGGRGASMLVARAAAGLLRVAQRVLPAGGEPAGALLRSLQLLLRLSPAAAWDLAQPLAAEVGCWVFMGSSAADGLWVALRPAPEYVLL